MWSGSELSAPKQIIPGFISKQFVNFLNWFVFIVIRIGLGILCKVDVQGLERIPKRGPLIVIANHTGSLEVPVIYGWLYPRPMTGWAKIETWDKPFFHWLFNLWGAVPVRRGEADTSALRQALERLEQGYIFGVTPEGTRNKTGKLLRAHPGVAMLATRSKAPIIPLVHWGGENFKTNLKRLRRTEVYVQIGKSFTIQNHGERITRDQRQQIADEMMYQVAALLPAEYRAAYSDMTKATTEFLKFE